MDESVVRDGSRVSDYDYVLPEDRIARHPAPRRDASRLLVVPPDRLGYPGPGGEDPFRHLNFSQLPSLFRAGDVLVVNESRVIPARFRGRRSSGADAEVLLLHPWEPNRDAEGSGDGVEAARGGAGDSSIAAQDGALLWEALVRPGNKLKPGRRVSIDDELEIEVRDRLPGGTRSVLLRTPLSLDEVFERFGEIPLPPYIDRPVEDADRERYQTVYAREPGSVAAPTAGLHFTERLLDELQALGVVRAAVTLHVGIGTFRPVDVEDPADHDMHREAYRVPGETAESIREARARGGRIWAVGTTAMRTLEAAADGKGGVREGAGATDLFIRPPFRFQVVDGLVTNFHLPRSTLMMLVAAFAGYDRTMAAYRAAVGENYRFYSYGDAMVIPPSQSTAQAGSAATDR